MLFIPGIPTGVMLPWGGPDSQTDSNGVPPGWLSCDASNVSRTTYGNLFNVIVPSVGTVTITLANPGVVTVPAAWGGMRTGDSIYLTTTGSLPTGLTANTLYYVIPVSTNTFNLATSRANAYASTGINTSVSQSGVHTMFWCPYGLGDGSTTFTVPDTRGRVLAGFDFGIGRLNLAQSQGSYGNAGASGGEQGHTLTSPGELPAHAHNTAPTTSDGNVVAGGAGGSAASITQTGAAFRLYSNVNGGSTGSSGAHNNIQPTLVVNYIIKT